MFYFFFGASKEIQFHFEINFLLVLGFLYEFRIKSCSKYVYVAKLMVIIIQCKLVSYHLGNNYTVFSLILFLF